jgi:hypothetical protein
MRNVERGPKRCSAVRGYGVSISPDLAWGQMLPPFPSISVNTGSLVEVMDFTVRGIRDLKAQSIPGILGSTNKSNSSSATPGGRKSRPRRPVLRP